MAFRLRGQGEGKTMLGEIAYGRRRFACSRLQKGDSSRGDTGRRQPFGNRSTWKKSPSNVAHGCAKAEERSPRSPTPWALRILRTDPRGSLRHPRRSRKADQWSASFFKVARCALITFRVLARTAPAVAVRTMNARPWRG